MGSAMYGNCVILATNLEEICTELPYFWKSEQKSIDWIKIMELYFVMVPQQVSE